MNTICYKHYIHLLSQWMERWHQESMSLFMQNMNLISLAMEAKESLSALCVVLWSPPWTQCSRCIFLVECMDWPHMHWKRLGTIGWRRPNLVCSVKEKMLKAILKDGMVRWAKSQTLEPGPTQDFSWTWWQSENNSQMMLENECSCMLSESMFS